jgi:hypothetical protein
MDLDQFRKIYSDYRLAEARTLANQYKTWDYSAQNSLMRVPLDKRQYDPTKDRAEELYHRDEKFVQMVSPKTQLSHLSPGIVGGITSKLSGKDFRDTSSKFATYGELFNHIDMVPDVLNIVKQMLNPLQTQIFIESINSINANEKSPGLLLSETLIAFIKKMTSSLISTKDALENNDRRLYKDSLNRLQLLTQDQSYRVLPSKAAEMLSRLTDLVLTLNNQKQDDFDEADTLGEIPDLRKNATRDAEDMMLQNELNQDAAIRAQTQLGAIVARQNIEQQLESINKQDYAIGASLLLNMYSDFLDQVTATTEAPLPLRSQATSAAKSSTVKTINTDIKSSVEKKEVSLADLLRQILEREKADEKPMAGEAGDDGGDEEDDNEDDQAAQPPAGTQPPATQTQTAPPQTQPPATQTTQAPAAPVRTTPQGPTLIVPNNPTMVPTQPTPAQQVPLYDEQGMPIGGPTITQAVAPQVQPPLQPAPAAVEAVDTQAAAPAVAQAAVPVATQAVTPAVAAATTPAVPAKVTPDVQPATDVPPLDADIAAINDIIERPWKEQWPILSLIKADKLPTMYAMTVGKHSKAPKTSIFYVKGSKRMQVYNALMSLKIKDDVQFTIDGIRLEGTDKKNYEKLQLVLKPTEQSSQNLTQTDEDIAVTESGQTAFKPKKVERTESRSTSVGPPPTRKSPRKRGDGMPKRGRGRPSKRDREDEAVDESKKARVQLPSSLSSFALPAQVSSSPDILDLHKNDIVTSITIKRSPIPQFMEDLFESLSNGTWSQLKRKHGFDSFFHLAAVINDDILVEKNSNGINVAIYKPYQSEEIKVPSKLLGKFTLGEMVEKVQNEMGQDFYNYHPFENNCQNFMFRFLKVSKALTPQIAEFVSQPIENLVKDLPAHFPPLVKAAADLYGVVQPLLNIND